MWEIAKENRTALDAMYEFNEISSDILPEDRLLVFRA